MKTYAYSTDEENYTGTFATPEEAAANCFDEDEYAESCWVGEMVTPRDSDYLRADLLLEHIRDREENSMDCAEDGWACTEEQEADLTRRVRECFDLWAKENKVVALQLFDGPFRRGRQVDTGQQPLRIPAKASPVNARPPRVPSI